MTEKVAVLVVEDQALILLDIVIQLEAEGFKVYDATNADAAILFAATLATWPAQEWNVHFSTCGRDRVTCVVDGDTIWFQGVNLRLESDDTPEPYNDICGGQAEIVLAKRASARLLQLLNGNTFTVETGGEDRYDRMLATIRIGGTDVGDILIAEGLARRWPNGEEFWC